MQLSISIILAGKGSLFIMLTMCAVVGCHNCYYKGSLIRVHHSLTDTERRHWGISFVSRQNVDQTLWKPGGDHL